uniref:Candidate secreted effector n=1 Tax=Meloidogyne incognita TaxID=6306 RepID=A0A914KKC4_MELIC
MPVKQINKAVWTIPVQTNITLCSPTNNKTFVIPSTTKISSKIEKKKEKKQQEKDNFEDMKKMIWMEKSWKQVPVGNDKPEAPEEKELPRCPKFIPSSLFMR